MRLKGLEPTRIAAREPKSRMSTNSITGADSVLRAAGTGAGSGTQSGFLRQVPQGYVQYSTFSALEQ